MARPALRCPGFWKTPGGASSRRIQPTGRTPLKSFGTLSSASRPLEPGADKRAQATRLLDLTVPSTSPRFRQFLETEAAELTRIGNTLRIRHSETDKEPLHSLEQADYLFHRMFSFLRLVLRVTGCGG